jgi:hypothetical protein
VVLAVGFKGALEGGAGRIFFVEMIAASLAFSVRVRFRGPHTGSTASGTSYGMTHNVWPRYGEGNHGQKMWGTGTVRRGPRGVFKVATMTKKYLSTLVCRLL